MTCFLNVAGGKRIDYLASNTPHNFPVFIGSLAHNRLVRHYAESVHFNYHPHIMFVKVYVVL